MLHNFYQKKRLTSCQSPQKRFRILSGLSCFKYLVWLITRLNLVARLEAQGTLSNPEQNRENHQGLSKLNKHLRANKQQIWKVKCLNLQWKHKTRNLPSHASTKHQQPCSKQIEMSELDTNPSPRETPFHHCNMQEKLLTSQPGTIKKKRAKETDIERGRDKSRGREGGWHYAHITLDV